MIVPIVRTGDSIGTDGRRWRPLPAVVLAAALALLLVATSVTTGSGSGTSSSAPYAVLVRDGDLVVFAKGTGVSAPATSGDGYSLYADAGLHPHYDVRLVQSPSIDAVRPYVEGAVAELRSATGQSVEVVAGYQEDHGPSVGEIDLVVSSSSPCRGWWLGCASPVVADGRIAAARIWINPRLFTKPVGFIENTVRHELGHALGLGHFNRSYDGEIQVMHATSFDATVYRSGDIAGLRALMGIAAAEIGSGADAAATIAATTPTTTAPTSSAPTTTVPEPTPTVSGDPTGSIEAVRTTDVGVVVRGSARDPDSDDPITVVISLDGDDFEMAAGRTGVEGSDGFEAVWPADPGEHEVCVRVRNVGPGEDVLLGCERVRVSSANLSRVGVRSL